MKWKNTAVMTQQWRLISPSVDGNEERIELYDILADPGQRKNVAAENPGIVEPLKVQYDAWWKQASALADQYVRIGLGTVHENPSFLNCMDWHGDNAILVWNQRQIRTAPPVNGFWAVAISRSGVYRFELRRWPRELDLAIDAPYIDPLPNMETIPGVAISATRAQLTVGSINESKLINLGDKFAEFVVSLRQGPAELRATFYGKENQQWGAYYVYVEHLT